MENRSLTHKLLAGQPLTSAEQAVVLASARRVCLARQSGGHGALLHGRHLALMAHADDEAAQLFHQSASELGAKVAWVAPVAANCTPAELQGMGRLLDHLYDGVECQGMPARLVRQLALCTSLPVFDGLATAGHPVAALQAGLDGLLPGSLPLANRRRLLTQAMLLTSIN